MSRGGARSGAGRPKGSPSKASQKRQAKIEATGETPLDVLIAGMRFHYSIAHGLLAQLKDPSREAVDILKPVAAALENAGEFANKAAPYVHPRLSAVEATGKGGEPLIPADGASTRQLAMAILALLRGSVVQEPEQPVAEEVHGHA